MKKAIYLFILLPIMSLLIYLGYTPETLSGESIPDEAIRLRILANSDSAKDQWVKRKVRDAVVQEMKSWPQQPNNPQQARQVIQRQMPKLHQVAQQTLHKYGFSYQVQSRFGQVPFPTKLYGGQVYPAGQYEALLITLGEGEGDNWWCVLFPPLCFIDMESGEAIPEEKKEIMSASTDPKTVYVNSEPEAEVKSGVQVKFLLWERISDWFRS